MAALLVAMSETQQVLARPTRNNNQRLAASENSTSTEAFPALTKRALCTSEHVRISSGKLALQPSHILQINNLDLLFDVISLHMYSLFVCCVDLFCSFAKKEQQAKATSYLPLSLHEKWRYLEMQTMIFVQSAKSSTSASQLPVRVAFERAHPGSFWSHPSTETCSWQSKPIGESRAFIETSISRERVRTSRLACDCLSTWGNPSVAFMLSTPCKLIISSL